MTIRKIYVEFHMITSFGCPWKVLGGPREILGGASGGPWGVGGGSLGSLWVSEGSLRYWLIQQEKCHKGHMSDHPMMKVKPTKYQRFRKILNLHYKIVVQKVMVKAM